MDKQRDNILMLLPNYGFGGAQRVHTQLVNSFSKQFNVIEVVFNNDERDVFNGVGLKVSLEIGAGQNLISKAFLFLKRCWRLNRLKAKFNCRACISHMEGANFVNLLSFGRGKKILCLHGSKTTDSNRKGVIRLIENNLLIPLCFNAADSIVTVSRGIKKELIHHFRIDGRRITVINNGIDIAKIQDLTNENIPLEQQLVFSKPVLVFSGRLALQKNPLPLLDIFNQVKTEVDCNLVILGDGPLKAEMNNKCANLNMEFCDFSLGMNYTASCTVFLMGFQDNPFKYLKNSTLFILTSNFEGFPLALCEALACGLPVVASDCQTGVRDILSVSVSENKTELEAPQYVECGVLMPLLEKGPDYELRVNQWRDTIVSLMKNKKAMNDYKQKVSNRSSDLSEDVFLTKWEELVKLTIDQ
jgi:glycosyltransferase involved in cell wall biosynthesis